jgi:hypothetical protein
MREDTYRKACLERRCTCPYTIRACPQHSSIWQDEPTADLDTRELVPYDDDNEDTLPDAGAETSHR